MDSIQNFGNGWKKPVLVYDASKHVKDWAKNSALTPTPYLRTNGDVRVFCGFRDDQGVSRIGYVDVDSSDPTRILKVSDAPVLDIGREGCFDDNGVILGDVVRHEGRVYMFYVGFQLVARVKFLAFTGLAVSDDDGDSFARVIDSPILDRHPGEDYFSAIHSALFEDGVWKLWYGAGSAWKTIDGKPFPSYGVHYVESADLLNIPNQRIVCFSPSEDEYRIGRPRVLRNASGYKMCFTAGTVRGEYFPGMANSNDGVNWTRDAMPFPISLSSEGWDSRHLSYPAFVRVGDRVLAFYNGNDMGRDGFGVAESFDPALVSMFSF